MVDLPQPSERVVTSEAARSEISAAEVASPYHMLGQALDKAGESLNAVAEPLAEQAGLSAVSRDEQGNLQVSKAPILGPAGAVYSRAMKFSALAQGEAEAKRKDIEISKQFPDDPQSYLTAAQSYRNGLVKDYSQKLGDEVGLSLGRAIDNTTTQNYRFMLLKQQERIRQNFDKDTSAAIADKTEDLFNIIKTGGENSPAAKQLVHGIIDLHNERVNNPVLGAPAEATKLELKALDEKVGAAKFAYQVNQTLKDPNGGVNAAMDQVEDVLKDDSLSPTQRVINHLHGLAEIKEFRANSEISRNLVSRQQKAKDDMAENAIIKDSASGNPTVTENDIKTNKDMSPESKMRMLAWVKRDGMPEPLTKVSQPTAMGLFSRMNLPDDDPNKISDLRPIRDAYTQGKLKREDEEWLEKRFVEGRSPEGSQLNQVRSQFNKAVEPIIDKSNPLLGHIDESGKMQNYAFQRFVDQKVDEYRKAGKNPADLFTPGKPDYLGKPEVVAPFQKTLQQSMQDATRRLTGGAMTPGPAEPTQAITPPAKALPPQREKGETPADYLKRIGAQ